MKKHKRLRMMFRASDMRLKRKTPKWVVVMSRECGLRPVW